MLSDCPPYKDLLVIVKDLRRQVTDLCRRVQELEATHVGLVKRGECPSDDGPDPFERLTSED